MIFVFQVGKTVHDRLPSTNTQEDPSEAKDAKEAKKQGVTMLDTDPTADQMGVMYHEYDLMFHYLLAIMRRADGANSVTTNGTKLFKIFSGISLSVNS
jgi:hypothetical protein